MSTEISIAGFGFPLKDPRIHQISSFEDDDTAFLDRLWGYSALIGPREIFQAGATGMSFQASER